MPWGGIAGLPAETPRRLRLPDRRRLAWFGLAAAALLAPFVAGLAIWVTGAVGTSEPDTAASLSPLEQGLQAHVEGRIDDAERAYQAVLLDGPSKFALYNLGLIAQGRGATEQADAYYRQALVIDPDYWLALYNLAVLRANAGGIDEAMRLYRRTIDTNPEWAGAHLNLGILLVAQGRKREGLAEIDTALKLDPSLGDAQTALSSAAGSPNAEPSAAPPGSP